MAQRVIIAILNWNKLELLKDCLESIFENTTYPDYRVCVLDQASSDGSVEYLEGLTDRIDIILRDKNTGFVGGNNIIMAAYPKDDIVLLNNDTLVTRGWLTSLVECAYSAPDIGIVGSKLVYPDGRLQEAGGEIYSDGSGRNIGKFDNPDKAEYNIQKEVDYCSGACLYIKRALLDKVGGFDPLYAPAYYEDTDLCFAARANGYRVMYQPKSKVIHLEGATSGTDLSSGFKRFQAINKPKFERKWAAALQRQRKSFWAAPEKAAKERVLIVSRFLPQFDRASGDYRLYQMVRILNKHYNVVFLAGDARDGERYAQKLRDMGVTVFCNDVERFPYLKPLVGNWSIDFVLMLKHNRFKAVIFEFYPIARMYMNLVRYHSPETAIITDSVDIHFLREYREALLMGDMRLLMQAGTNKRSELGTYAKSDVVVTVTDEDERFLRQELEEADIRIIPNIHEPSEHPIQLEGRSGLLFVGGFLHPPNVDSMLYFCRDILPLVRREIPEITLTIVGNAPPPEVTALTGDGITVTGFVPSTTPYLDAALVSIAPLRYGAGMKGKVGEAMAYGLPVVTTSIGSEGIGAAHGEHLLVADSAEDFAKAIVRLCKDPGLWQKIAEQGRRFIDERYSTGAIERNIRAIMSSLPKPGVKGKGHFDISGRDLLKGSNVEGVGPFMAVERVTVVIPVYNETVSAIECIGNVIEHTDNLHEIIVVDDASQEGITQWCELNHISYIRNEKPLKIKRCCAQGYLAATSRYVVMLAPQCYLSPHWDTALIECMKAQKGVKALGIEYADGQFVLPYHFDEYSAELYEKNRGGWKKAVNLSAAPCLIISAFAAEPGGTGKPLRDIDEVFLNMRSAGYSFGFASAVKAYPRSMFQGKAVFSPGFCRLNVTDVPYPKRKSVSVIILCHQGLDTLGMTIESFMASIDHSLHSTQAAASDPVFGLAMKQMLRPHAFGGYEFLVLGKDKKGPALPEGLDVRYCELNDKCAQEAVKRLTGDVVIVMEGNYIVPQGFLAQALKPHLGEDGGSTFLIGNGIVPLSGSQDDFAEYLHTHGSRQRRLPLSISPLYCIAVSMLRKTFDLLGSSLTKLSGWSLQELVHRAESAGLKVHSDRIFSIIASPPVMGRYFELMYETGIETARLEWEHPHAMWSYEDSVQKIQCDYLAKGNTVDTVLAMLKNISELPQDKKDSCTLGAKEPIADVLYTILLNYHYARGLYDGFSAARRADWLPEYYKERKKDLDSVTKAAGAEGEMNMKLIESALAECLGDDARSLRLIKEAAAAMPSAPQPHSMLAERAMRCYDLQEAEYRYGLALKAKSKHQSVVRDIFNADDTTTISLYLASVLLMEEKFDEVIGILGALDESGSLLLLSKKLIAYEYLAEAHMRMGHNDEALRYSKEAFDFDRKNDLLLHIMLCSMYRLGMAEQAAQILRQASLVGLKDINIFDAKDGKLTAMVKTATGEFMLHSGYRPYDEASNSIADPEGLKGKLILQLGLGLGYPLVALWDKLGNDTPVLAVESNTLLFHTALTKTIGTGALDNPALELFVGLWNVEKVYRKIVRISQKYSAREIVLLEHAPSIRLNPGYYAALRERLARG